MVTSDEEHAVSTATVGPSKPKAYATRPARALPPTAVASELSGAITGETIYVDCGYNIMGF